MYKLNKESVTVKFYEWIWNTKITKFKTMCPYFWKYVLTIIFLPIILICKGVFRILPESEKVNRVFNYIEESKFGDGLKVVTKPSRFWDVIGNIFKWLFFMFAGLIIVSGVLVACISFWNNPKEGFLSIGIIALLCLIIVGITYLFTDYDMMHKIGTPFRFVGNMISSLYHNMCPLIIWK